MTLYADQNLRLSAALLEKQGEINGLKAELDRVTGELAKVTAERDKYKGLFGHHVVDRRRLIGVMREQRHRFCRLHKALIAQNKASGLQPDLLAIYNEMGGDEHDQIECACELTRSDAPATSQPAPTFSQEWEKDGEADLKALGFWRDAVREAGTVYRLEGPAGELVAAWDALEAAAALESAPAGDGFNPSFPHGHHYTSTACHHGLHDRCRKTCKFCVKGCACACHGSATQDGPEPVGTLYCVFVDKTSVGGTLEQTRVRHSPARAQDDLATLRQVEPYPLIMMHIPPGQMSWSPMPEDGAVRAVCPTCGGLDGTHLDRDREADGPGQTETDEAHGWTGHGHPCCPRARLAGRPTSLARCGGPGMCDKCSQSSARIHNKAAAVAVTEPGADDAVVAGGE